MVTIRFIQAHPNCLVVNETCFSASDLVSIIMNQAQRTVTFRTKTDVLSFEYNPQDFDEFSLTLARFRPELLSFE